jgi:hypothetical protein
MQKPGATSMPIPRNDDGYVVKQLVALTAEPDAASATSVASRTLILLEIRVRVRVRST